VAYTPEDLSKMPDGELYELVDGNLVERKMSMLSSYVAGEIYDRLKQFSKAHQPGWVFPEGTSYQCFPSEPERVRRLDASFIRRERLSPERLMQEGHAKIAPDLAVEVVPPNDLAYEVDEKVDDYLDAGIPLVWVVNPRSRTVRVHWPDRPGV